MAKPFEGGIKPSLLGGNAPIIATHCDRDFATAESEKRGPNANPRDLSTFTCTKHEALAAATAISMAFDC